MNNMYRNAVSKSGKPNKNTIKNNSEVKIGKVKVFHFPIWCDVSWKWFHYMREFIASIPLAHSVHWLTKPFLTNESEGVGNDHSSNIRVWLLCSAFKYLYLRRTKALRSLIVPQQTCLSIVNSPPTAISTWCSLSSNALPPPYDCH